LQDKIAMLLML